MDFKKKTGIFSAIIFIFFLLPAFMENETTPFQFPDLRFFPEMPLPENNAITVEGAELGRHLFYDPALSLDSSLSCASCHKQRFAFGDSVDFSPGFRNEKMTRNTMPLFNLAWFPAFFWDGKAATLEEQVFHPVRAHNEMNLQWEEAVRRVSSDKQYRIMFRKVFGDEKIDSIRIAKAIAQFERTLISCNSKFDSVLRRQAVLNKDEYEGFVLMNDQTRGDCLHCHTSDADALGTTRKFSNNGLDAFFKTEDYKDKGRGGVTGMNQDIGLFKIPSLRNVAVTAPYMHDGRFRSLEEVLDFYSEGVKPSVNLDSKMNIAHGNSAKLTQDEKRKIIAFLKTLTDHSLLTSKAFSAPEKF